MQNTKSGIYRIENTITRKVYIGQAGNLKKRYCDHISALRRNNHDNKYLQNAWNKYTEEDFVFSILEECEVSKLAYQEQYWMDYYKCYDRKYGYNINPSSTENPMLGQTHTSEARAKISAKAKGRVMSQANKDALIKANKNVPKPQRKLKSNEVLSFTEGNPNNRNYLYFLFDTEENYYIFNNLSQFCKENKCSNTHLGLLLKKGTFYKGWSGFRLKTKQINLKPKTQLIVLLNTNYNYA